MLDSMPSSSWRAILPPALLKGDQLQYVVNNFCAPPPITNGGPDFLLVLLGGV